MMDRSAWAFGLIAALLSWNEPAPCTAQPPTSKGTSKAAPPELLPPLQPLTDPLENPPRPSATSRTVPPPKRGPSQTEIEAENLSRTWPLLSAILSPAEAWPLPAITGTVPTVQMWPSPAAGAARRDCLGIGLR